MNSLATFLPLQLILQSRSLITKSIVPGTLSNYAAGLLHFTQFCDELRIPEALRMPASEDILTLFVAAKGAHKVSATTIKHWLLGLELWHTVNGAPWLGASALKCALKVTSIFPFYFIGSITVHQASASLAPASSTRPKRAPVTIDHLRSLRRHLDFTDPFEVTIFAGACVAFWAQARLGELIFDGSFDPLLHASRGDFTLSCSTSGRRYGKLWVPRTKTKPLGDSLIFTDSNCECSAIAALLAHFQTNSSIPSSAPVFAFETLDGSFSPMRRSWFLARCNDIWQRENPARLLGHAFRIGGTTHLLLLGVDPFIVMVQGRWSSTAFLSYWRLCEEIVPLFVGFSLESKLSILSTMSSFKAKLVN